MTDKIANLETAVLDERNPLPFYAQSLRMAAQAVERSVNDPRPQHPDFVPAALEDAVYHAVTMLQLLRHQKMPKYASEAEAMAAVSG